ncbi:MAG: DNA-processing protein DprA, partial [Proteobacteria bacterium]|nr:DNA-processing protein DprA [Pseudomonadota bacterium]
MDEQKIKSWLHLLNAPGLGHVRISGLLNHYSSANKIIQQSQFPEELKIPPQAIKYITNAVDEDIEKELLWLQQENNHLIALDDPLYPSLLKQSASPPVALFVKGDSKTLLLPQLAVVGSRNASKGGLANAKSFCADLAAGGLTITSGLAIGIDAMAHQAALENGGKTIAVMGTG